MGNIANTWGNLTPNCENGWATSCLPHFGPQFHYIFCGIRLTKTQNTEVQDCIDPTASDIKWKYPSHIIPGLLKRKQYIGIHIQASVLSILCHDRHWPWRNTGLCGIAKRNSTMFIFMYDHPLWWKSIIIIKNKQGQATWMALC